MRWAFFAYGYNYGDLSRAVEVAKAMRASGAEVAFFHHGGTFTDRIAEAGFEPVELAPSITAVQHQRLMEIDQHRAPVGTPLPFDDAQLAAMVESELDAFRRLQPDGVYCGLNLTCMISVPYAKLPMVTLVPTALCPAFFERGMASFPDAMDRNPLLRWLVPTRAKRALINRIMLGDAAKKSAEAFNRVRARYGLAPIYNYTALVRGDLTLLPDLPALSGLPREALPRGYAYCGPIFARLDLPVPEDAARVFTGPGVKVYCAMGSSGSSELLRLVVNALRGHPEYRVVCATTTILDPREFGPPTDRFFAARFLPAHMVSEMADVIVSHGGQGTVQTAMWAGKPLVGIGFQWEQQANLDALERAGAGIRIPIHSVTAARVLREVERARGASYRSGAEALRTVVRATDGAGEAVRLMTALAGRAATTTSVGIAPASTTHARASGGAGGEPSAGLKGHSR